VAKRVVNLGREELWEDDYVTPRQRRLLGLPKDAPAREDLRRSDDLRGGRRRLKGK
jgi:hypothetical protein